MRGTWRWSGGFLSLLAVACGPSEALNKSAIVPSEIELYRGALVDATVKGGAVYAATAGTSNSEPPAVYRIDPTGAVLLEKFPPGTELRFITETDEPVLAARQRSDEGEAISLVAYRDPPVSVSVPASEGTTLRWVGNGAISLSSDAGCGPQTLCTDTVRFSGPNGVHATRTLKSEGGLLGLSGNRLFWVADRQLMALSFDAPQLQPIAVLSFGPSFEAVVSFDPSSVSWRERDADGTAHFRFARLADLGHPFELPIAAGATLGNGELGHPEIFTDGMLAWWFETRQTETADGLFYALARFDPMSGKTERWSLGLGRQVGFAIAGGGALFFTDGDHLLAITASGDTRPLTDRVMLPIGVAGQTLVALDPMGNEPRLVQLDPTP